MRCRLPSLSDPSCLSLRVAATALLLAGCANTTPTPNPASDAAAKAGAVATSGASPAAAAAAAGPSMGPTAATAGAPIASAPARPPAAGQPQPFAEVTRGATRSDGYLPVWTRDDKTWLEIPAQRLDQAMFLGISIAGGLGERGFFPGLMGREQVVVLRRVGNSVQLVARNLLARADAEGSPLAQAVAESYSDSLLGVAPLVAAPHAQSQALLVDAAQLLGGDLAGMQTRLETSFRLAYSLDRSNSSIERARSTPEGLFLTLRQHYALPRLPAPPVLAPGAPPPNPATRPNPPSSLPDARSLFLGLAVNLVPVPAQPMRPRAADLRVGYFTHSYLNFADDTQEGQRSHMIKRWRLEKQDPAAALSEPKSPIRVVLDRNVPLKWRPPLREAALEWNKAFERAGFRNAIVVEQQPDDADWSTLEGTGILAVRWFAQQGPGSTAVGPSQADPRTGEILRGAAIIDENRVRVMRARATESVPRWADTLGAAPLADPMDAFAQRLISCDFAETAFDEAQFALELLSERGLIDPQGPEAERFIADALKNVTMHEIGHALGLRHNFRASTTVTHAQLRDPAFTAANPMSASVMDYNGQNLPLQGEPVPAQYNMTTLGAYDLWAIEYGYREFADEQAEKLGLQALAARAERDPALAYATDEDLANNDPMVNHRDMGDDPLVHAQRQITLARELFDRATGRPLAANEDLSLYRRAVNRVLGTLGSSLPLATKHVGGVYTTRALAGADRPLLVPVPAARQRQALDLVVEQLFTSASFRFDPRVMSRLGVDHAERLGPGRSAGVDFSLPTAVLGLQRGALDQLMADALAARMADAESLVADPRQLISYAEVQQRLSQAVWSELAPGATGRGEIDSLRRNLQREHLRRLAAGLIRPASAAAADVRAVHRQVALQLQSRLRIAVATRRGSPLVQAHLADSLATLEEALKAPLVKQVV